MPSGNQTWQVEILDKWRFEWENHHGISQRATFDYQTNQIVLWKVKYCLKSPG